MKKDIKKILEPHTKLNLEMVNKKLSKNRLLAVFGVFVLFSIFRLDSLRFIWSSPEIRLLGPDSYYHLRRIIYTFENFPDLLIFDDFLSYPDGDFVPWTALFDFTLGAVAKLFRDPVICSVIIPYIFSIPLFLIIFLYQKNKGFIEVTSSLVILSASIGLANIQSVGYVDHHFLEVLLVCLFYLILDWELSFFKKALFLALVVSLSFLNWPGAPLYYGPFFLFIIYKVFKKQINSEIVLLSAISFIACSGVLTLFFALTDFDVFPYSFKFLSAFQRDFALLAGLILLWIYFYVSKNISRYIVVTFILIAFLIMKELFFEVFNGLAYLGKAQENRLMRLVAESLPLFFGKTQLIEDEIKRNILIFTPLFFFIPFMFYHYFKNIGADILLFAFCYFFLLTCFQVRFNVFFIPFYALLGGFWIGNLRKVLREVIFVSLIIYSLGIYMWRFNLGPIAHDLARNQLYQTMHFLREKTHQRELFIKGETPYGVLSDWSIGHYIITLGNRPAAAHNFIAIAKNNKEIKYIEAVFSKDEEQVLRIMDELNAPYLVIYNMDNIILNGWYVLYDSPNPYVYADKKGFTLNEKVEELFLYRLRNGESAKHLRLVFEADYGGNMINYSGVFQRVKGVKVITEKKAKVIVSISTVNDDILLEYEPKMDEGRYIFTIPYSSDMNDNVIVNSIMLKTDKGEKKLIISQEDVLMGREIYLKNL